MISFYDLLDGLKEIDDITLLHVRVVVVLLPGRESRSEGDGNRSVWSDFYNFKHGC